MPTYLITWNPDKYAFDELVDYAAKLSRGEEVKDRWSSGNRLAMPLGSKLFLLRQGKRGHLGIVGSARSTSQPQVGPHYNPELRAQGVVRNFVELIWKTLVVPGVDEILAKADLLDLPIDPATWDTQSSGIEIPEPGASALKALWHDHLLSIGHEVQTLPEKENELTGEDPLRLIKARRGQEKFRRQLMDRYESKCVISGCDLTQLLEAAHIKPYSTEIDNSPENGLLLRSDLHTLYDLGLLGIDPETLMVHVHRSVRSNGYERFNETTLCCGNKKPSLERLKERWLQFKFCS